MLSERASRNAVAAVRASGTGAPAAQPTLSREWLYQVHESIRDVPLGTLSVPSNDTSPFENSGAAMSGAAFAGYSQTESPQNHGSVGMGFVRIQDINSVAASLADENGVVNAEAFFSAMRAEIPTLSSDPQAIAGAAFLSSRNGNDWATMFAESVVGYMNHSENGVDYLIVEVTVSPDSQTNSQEAKAFSRSMSDWFRTAGIGLGCTLDVMPVIRLVTRKT